MPELLARLENAEISVSKEAESIGTSKILCRLDFLL